MASKEMVQLARRLERQGWAVSRTKRDHYRFVSPDGTIVYAPGTPSDHRSIHNVIAKLKRTGADL